MFEKVCLRGKESSSCPREASAVGVQLNQRLGDCCTPLQEDPSLPEREELRLGQLRFVWVGLALSHLTLARLVQLQA